MFNLKWNEIDSNLFFNEIRWKNYGRKTMSSTRSWGRVSNESFHVYEQRTDYPDKRYDASKILRVSFSFLFFLFLLLIINITIITFVLISEIRSLPKNVKDYRKCVDPFSKQVISIVLPNLIKSVKRVCVTHKECKTSFFKLTHN